MTTILDAVATATAAVPRAYQLGTVPAAPTYPYTVWSAQLLEEDVETLDGRGSIRWAQIVTQTFGRTLSAVNDQTEKFRNALLGTWLAFDGYEAGPIASELRPTPPSRDPDAAGVLGSTSTLTAPATAT
jgi:hypothetical protein